MRQALPQDHPPQVQLVIELGSSTSGGQQVLVEITKDNAGPVSRDGEGVTLLIEAFATTTCWPSIVLCVAQST
jgi:hypothetical protein